MTIATARRGLWSFNEASGTTLYDNSGYGNDGTITAGTGGWTTNAYGKSVYEFDGSATLVTIADSDSLDILPTVNMCIWVNIIAIGSPGYMISRNANGTGTNRN